MVKLYLSRNNIEYSEHNVSNDRDALKELVTMGFRSTPVTVIGDENVVGYISDLTHWKKNRELDYIHSIDSTKIDEHKNNLSILDVRREDELRLGFVKDSINIPLSQLSDNLDKIPKSNNLIIYCAGGYRSMIASSILQSKGFKGIKNIYGGFSEIARNSPYLI